MKLSFRRCPAAPARPAIWRRSWHRDRSAFQPARCRSRTSAPWLSQKGPENFEGSGRKSSILGPNRPPNRTKQRQQCPGGGAHKPAQADSDRFRIGLGVFPPRSRTFTLRDTLCCAIVLPGRESAFRAGFWPDCYRESTDIGPPAGRRPAGGLISVPSR